MARRGIRQVGRVSYSRSADGVGPGSKACGTDFTSRNVIDASGAASVRKRGDRLGHETTFLGLRPPLDQHGEVELLRGQPFERVLANVAEIVLPNVPQQPIFQVGVAELAGVVVPQDAIDVRGRQQLAHDIEDGVVLQCVADFLQLAQQLAENLPLDRVRGDEVENVAVFRLAVTVDAAHPLLKASRVPGQIVIEQDIAALQVDAFAGSLGGDEDLGATLARAVAEFLLGAKPGAGLVPGAGLHAAVDALDGETPFPQFQDEVIEGVAELREDEQAAIRVGQEVLALKELGVLPRDDVMQPFELGLGAGLLDGLRIPRMLFELGDFLMHELRILGQRDGREDVLQPLTLVLVHLLQVFGGR